MNLHKADPANVGPWRLLGDLGSGRMGPLHRAELAESEGPGASVQVALRVLAPGVMAADVDDERLTRMIAAALQMNSANASSIVDADLAAVPAWVAAEFVEGKSLHDRVAVDGPLTTVEWFGVAAGLLTALQALHEAGMVHGDVKPANLVLSARGPVLIDPFLASFDGPRVFTAAELSAGEPSWLSPEEVAGRAPDFASDIFAAGEVLAYAATGRFPWGPPVTNADVIRTRIAGEPPDCGGMAGIPAALVGELMAKEPSERPDAIEAIAILTGERVRPLPIAPIAVLPEPRTHPLPAMAGPARSLKVPLALLAAALLVVGTVGIALTRGGGSESASPDPSATSSAASPAASQGESSPASEPTIPAAPPVYSVSVDYTNTQAPDARFPGGLDWTFDVCLKDQSFNDKALVDKVYLYVKESGRWKRQSATASAISGGRCPSESINVTMDATATPVSNYVVGSGWSPCAVYRVVIPETRRFKKSYVDMCVRTSGTVPDAAS